jgi:hypothetical protein
VVLAEGDFDLGEIRRTFSKVRARSPLPAATRLLVHDLGSSFQPSHTDLTELVELFEELFGGLSTKIALVLERDEQQEAGRMLVALCREARFELAVFRELSAAPTWLET